MQLGRQLRIQTLMIMIAILAVVLYADLLRRRRAKFLEKAKNYASQARLISTYRLTREGELALATSELARARDRLAWAERMKARGFVSEELVASYRSALARCSFSLQQAEADASWIRKRAESTDKWRRLYDRAAAYPWRVLPPEPPASLNGN
ncbi:MAG TPA: hypothetical protein VGZ22_01890 [Isosphaeraceae bacterium]|nr:hypothetical protein [Isosphaeraceae bacterium]